VSLPVLFFLLGLESSPDGLVNDPFAGELAVTGVESVEFTRFAGVNTEGKA
jgi:hypothetical protein